jgi:hypothetical protein
LRGSSSPAEPPVAEGPRPDVVLDVEFDAGVLYLVVANIGERPAVAVAFRFEQPFRGLGGTEEMTRLPLLRRIEFLVPHKQIRTLLDASAAYFARREPTKLAVTITYRDEGGSRYERRIVHDLRIYRDLAYVAPQRGEVSDRGAV